MSPIEPLAVRAVDVVHQPRHGVLIRDNQQMVMVPQKAVRQASDSKPLEGDRQTLQELRAIDIVLEDRCFVIAAREQVVRLARNVDAKRSSHAQW